MSSHRYLYLYEHLILCRGYEAIGETLAVISTMTGQIQQILPDLLQQIDADIEQV
jgi:hypothetical protein